MKVSDVMSKHVDFVTADTTIKEVARLIFGRGINGVPVCKGKKIIGFITERDILAKFYPSLAEYIEDPVHSADFEAMEKNAEEIFKLTADKIMTKNPTAVRPETPLLRAHSLMAVHKVGRLPVVDNKGNLIGIIAKGDIFRAAVGNQLPLVLEEEYHDWLSKHYDLVVPWGDRLEREIPDLVLLFENKKVKSIVDIGCGTGEHDLSLGKEGFNVLGLENSSLMYKAGLRKLRKASAQTQKRVHFENGDYIEVLNKYEQKFDAAIFMGNAFLHLARNYRDVFAAVSKGFVAKNALVFMQIINFQKVFKIKKRFLDLNFADSKFSPVHQHAFLEFYDPPQGGQKWATLNMAIFDFDGKHWKYRSMNSTPVVKLDKEDLQKLFRKHGFKKIEFYGSTFLGPLFKDKFDPENSDWLNVVAKR